MRISIVTVCRNADTVIADCLASVRCQIAPPGLELEHVVVDGASMDGTLGVVAEATSWLGPVNYHVVSEPDRGLYDAMNKGVALATGDVVGILNADDFLASPDVLHQVAEAFAVREVAAAYGDLVYVCEQNDPGVPPKEFPVVRCWRSGRASVGAFRWGWMPPHPAFWLRKSVYDRLPGYRLDLGTSADYELMLRVVVKERIPLHYIRETLVCMRAGGASNVTVDARMKANRADRLAWSTNNLRPLPWTFLAKPLRKLPQWLLKPRTAYGRWWLQPGPVATGWAAGRP